MSHQAINVSYAWTRKQPTPLCPVDINACALTAQFWWTSARCVVWQNSASSKYLDDCCFFDIAHYLSHTTSLDHAGTCPVCPCRISLLLPHQFNLIVCGLDDKIVRASTRMRKENAKIAWQCNRTAKPKHPYERCGFRGCCSCSCHQLCARTACAGSERRRGRRTGTGTEDEEGERKDRVALQSNSQAKAPPRALRFPGMLFVLVPRALRADGVRGE